MEHTDANQLIGFCGFLRLDQPGPPVHGEFEIGWRLASHAWRKGFGLEAASEALRFAFEDFGVSRIVSRIADCNQPSVRLAKALGLVVEPHLKHCEDGDSTDLSVFVMTRQQYRERGHG